MTITEQMSYSTVRIETENSEGEKFSGTGYFFVFKKEKNSNRSIPVVITNKHVVEDAKKGTLVFTLAKNNIPIDQEHFRFNIEDFRNLWTFHPDTNVDLCAMPIAIFLNEAKNQNKELFFIPLDISLIPDENVLIKLSAMEDIVMVGYPNGIWDKVNNKPIFRKGVTATHPAKDYNGKKEFLIDAACFPGSSGSPVFILNENGYRDNLGNMIMGSARVLFMGTLYAGPQYVASGNIEIVEVPTVQKPIAQTSIPNNLGIVIKSIRVKELEAMFGN
jgi:hypothetical protein